MKATARCEYCHGLITAPKRCSMKRTLAIHLDACPAAHRGRKKVTFTVTEDAPLPAPPRKRVIPRQVL
jgi:hypothetical protein